MSTGDRTPPQITVMRGARRNDPESAAGARAEAIASAALDHRRVDLVLGAVAVDRRSRCPCDHRSDAALERAPDEPVDEGILEARQRSPAA